MNFLIMVYDFYIFRFRKNEFYFLNGYPSGSQNPMGTFFYPTQSGIWRGGEGTDVEIVGWIRGRGLQSPSISAPFASLLACLIKISNTRPSPLTPTSYTFTIFVLLLLPSINTTPLSPSPRTQSIQLHPTLLLSPRTSM